MCIKNTTPHARTALDSEKNRREFGINFFFEMYDLSRQVYPAGPLTHPHRPPSDPKKNCPVARGSRRVPMWGSHVFRKPQSGLG